MTSHKRVNNNGAVREENELSFTITRDIAAEHYWEMHRGNLSLSLSHNLVINCINCISVLSTAQASVTRFKITFEISNWGVGWDAEEIILLTIAI